MNGRVLIHVRGGIAEVVEQPKGVTVDILDLDLPACSCCYHYHGTFHCHGVDCQRCANCDPE